MVNRNHYKRRRSPSPVRLDKLDRPTKKYKSVARIPLDSSDIEDAGAEKEQEEASDIEDADAGKEKEQADDIEDADDEEQERNVPSQTQAGE